VSATLQASTTPRYNLWRVFCLKFTCIENNSKIIAPYIVNIVLEEEIKKLHQLSGISPRGRMQLAEKVRIYPGG
jgi:hypothetical protein